MNDRVEKALEKARQQRMTSAALPKPNVPKPKIVRGEGADPIVYNATRRQKVTEETLRKNRIVAGQTADWRADAFRVLRAQVLKKMADGGWTTLGITSAAAGDGKTLTAVNLAVSIAQDMNQTVLLVDADLRRPGIHFCFDLHPEYGLSDYLRNSCPLEACLINPGIERLVILPQVGSIADSSEVLAMPRTRALTAELKTRYPDRLVLYDLPPLLASDDALVILPYLDASLLVVQEGKTEESEVERALELLAGHNWLGSVLNRVQRGEGSHYY